MGGPWRERGFDAASLRVPGRQGSEVRTDVREGNGLGGVVLAFITAVVLSFGLMLSLLHHGW
jgi:hypothetical protein